MSGFVGVLHADGLEVDEPLLARLTESMTLFAPDGRNTWVGGQVGFGHALLADQPGVTAVDPQPSRLHDRLWIVADARLDDRAELLRQLRSVGRRVEPDATEACLLLHAYDVWAERCLDRIIGDFSFAIWDGAKQRLFCARDHFGVVPFYYARPNGDFLFSNAVWPIRLHPAVSDELDDRAVADFLLFGWRMDLATTTFADIRALPPGHSLTVDRTSVRVRRYWGPPESVPELRLPRTEDYVERFRTIFDAATDDRLRSTRVATHLSGGMDSTSIAATAHRLLESRGGSFDLRAYTLSANGLISDEEPYFARQVAGAVGLDLEHLAMIDYATRAPEQNDEWGFPEPVTIASQSADFEVLRRASSFARAVLVGLGGDPLLASDPSWPRGVAQWRDRLQYSWDSVRAGHLPRFGLRSAIRRRRAKGWAYEPPALEWVNPDFARGVDLWDRWEEMRARPTSAYGDLVHPTWPAIFAASHPGVHGLPIRAVFPFFDMRLVRFVRAAPAYPWRQNKRLLREAMRDRLPRAVLERPKTPLFSATAPVTDDPRYRLALLPETARSRKELLSVPALRDYVDVERALELVQSPVPGSTSFCFSNCFPFAHWLRGDSEALRRLRAGAMTRHVAASEQ